VQPGDGGVWLEGEEAARVAQVALLVPVVLGNVDITVLEPLAETAACCHELRERIADAAAGTSPGVPEDLAAELAKLETQLIGHAIALVSGSGGLASVLRTGLLGRPLAGQCLPLDMGDTSRIPPRRRGKGPALRLPWRLRPARRGVRTASPRAP
jgi:hypothetical protein